MPPIASVLLCGWLQMRAAVQLAERVQFLRGSVRGSFSAPLFTPFPLRTNVQATEAHLKPWPGGLQVGCGLTVCLAHLSQREIFLCASWPRGYCPSRRESALSCFHPSVKSFRCLLFVDNQGTRFSLLRGVSENSVVDFLAENVELEAVTHTFTWLARVPSSCNVADAPSRGDVSAALLNNALDVRVDAERLLLDLVSQLSEMGKIGCAPNPTAKRKRVSAAS